MGLTLGLPVSLDPCENIRSEIDEKIHALEQQSVLLRSQIAKLRNEIMGFIPPMSPVHDVDGAIGNITTDSFNAGATAYSAMQNFTGTCADSIFNGVRKYAAEVESYMNDMLGNTSALSSLPEYNALQAFRDYKQALGASAVSNLLADIDEKLGCLADNSELATCLELFDWFNTRVEDLLKYMGLSEAGSLDLYSFAAQFGINIPGMVDLFDNMNRLDEHLVTVQTEIEANVEKVGESITNAQGKVTSTVQDWF
jgi:hypothetical protein